jgi:uncharacterized membrane protein YgdD (TMEM256/DUF423 family)
MTNEKKIIATGAVFGGLAIAAGAFGAHGLKQLLPADQLQVFDTAVRYQFYHGLALITTGLLIRNFNNKNLARAGNCFIAGTILFSGSLYILSTSALLNIQMNWIGIITPIGGLLMITGWILLLIGILRSSPVI